MNKRAGNIITGPSRSHDPGADAARRFESNIDRIRTKRDAGEPLTDQERFFIQWSQGLDNV